MVLRIDARECFPTAVGSSNLHTRAAALQCEGTGKNPMRCITDGPRCCPVAEWEPVAYASRALSLAETRYAKIEIELLAIVFACERFETYIYVVHVDSDHKPL